MTTLDFKCVFFARPSSARGNIKKKGVPIYMRIKYKGREKVIATGINGPHDKWARHLQRFNCDSRFARAANKKLEDMSRFVDDRYWHMEKSKEVYDFDTLLAKITGKEEVITLLALVEKRLEQIKKLEGKRYSHGTVKIYNNALNHLRAYFAHIGKKDLAIKQIKQGFINDFFEFLLLRVSTNTANKVLRKLKAVLSYAVEQEMLDQHPFKGWKIKDTKVHRQALSQTEIEKLSSLEIDHPGVERVRDVFVFQCLTGLAYIDVYELKKKHIKREGDDVYIDKIRHKTNNRAIIPLMTKAVKLVDKYIDGNGPKVFPVYTLQTMNKYLGAIRKLAEIEKPITTHIGRHTFATTIATEHGIAREHLETMMALSSGHMATVYAKISRQVLSNVMKNIDQKLKL
jgi:site-specific recombinase XerD